ncbi:MAG: hypothetical protein LBQ42_06560, partial [Synergistaceae bacterium]|nr:hypothetical protein [Synergistaceae bacterium]
NLVVLHFIFSSITPLTGFCAILAPVSLFRQLALISPFSSKTASQTLHHVNYSTYYSDSIFFATTLSRSNIKINGRHRKTLPHLKLADLFAATLHSSKFFRFFFSKVWQGIPSKM